MRHLPEALLRFKNHCHQEYLLQYSEGFSRRSSFYLSNWDIEEGGEWQFQCHFHSKKLNLDYLKNCTWTYAPRGDQGPKVLLITEMEDVIIISCIIRSPKDRKYFEKIIQRFSFEVELQLSMSLSFSHCILCHSTLIPVLDQAFLSGCLL